MEEKEILLVSEDKLAHYKKGTYSGGHRGMRYFLESVDKEEERFLKLSIWPEPYRREATAQEEIVEKEFAFTEEGLQQAEEYLNQTYREKQEYWNQRAQISTLYM